MEDNQTEKQKVQELTDKLERGLTELFNSDSYKNYLSTMSKFHNYSFNNTLLIAMQKLEASLVAGYKAWQKNFERFQMTLEEFVHIENLRWRDQKRGRIIKKILSKEENMVFVISPISYTDNFGKRITEDNILSIELVDTPANIFDRLVFSDTDDTIYKDDDYKNQCREYNMSDIKADLEWYGNVYSKIGVKNRFEINNDSPKTAVKRLIKEYGLSE